jgi:hypothetical protein
MEFIISQVVFDEFRNIVQVPDWASLVKGLVSLPSGPTPQPSDPAEHDPVLQEWKEMVFNPDGREAGSQARYSYADLRDPCDGCPAYCCNALVFPYGLPTTAANLDHLKFCLGFPGVELGIADDVWSLVVNTTCRHLKDNRCSIHGKPERPILCQYYDAWKCTYKVNFGMPRPPGFLRVKLEQFDWLTESFGFDQNGNIVEGLPTKVLRGYIEEKWRGAFAQPAET